jgi:hypothetical protein
MPASVITTVPVLPSLLAALLLAAATETPAAGLGALPRLALEVSVSPEVPGVAAGELAGRVDAALRAGRPAPAVDPASPDTLRLTVSVDRVNATELRGFYLPFSGDYGLGFVRLAVERAVTVPGVAGPVRAVVWQAERPVRMPWHRSGTAIAPLADALIAEFLEAYRRASEP